MEKIDLDSPRFLSISERCRIAADPCDTAVREAGQFPQRAEQEAQALIEKARADAEEEARQLIAQAQSEEESTRILAKAEEDVRNMETVAMSHFDRAVAFVLDRIAGRE